MEYNSHSFWVTQGKEAAQGGSGVIILGSVQKTCGYGA